MLVFFCSEVYSTWTQSSYLLHIYPCPTFLSLGLLGFPPYIFKSFVSFCECLETYNLRIDSFISTIDKNSEWAFSRKRNTNIVTFCIAKRHHLKDFFDTSSFRHCNHLPLKRLNLLICLIMFILPKHIQSTNHIVLSRKYRMNCYSFDFSFLPRTY